MGEQLFRKAGEFVPDKLIADVSIPVTAKGITVAKGEGALKRGTLLGIAADGKYRRTDTEEGVTTGEGDSTTPTASAIGADCILTDDVDATASDVVTSGYVTGAFNAAAIIVPEGKTVLAHEDTLRQLGIFLRAVQEY